MASFRDLLGLKTAEEVAMELSDFAEEWSEESLSDDVDLTCTPPHEVPVIPLVDLTSPTYRLNLRTNGTTHGSTRAGARDNNNHKPADESEETTVLRVKCPVCLEHLDKLLKRGVEIRSTTCGHVFCKPCITTSVRAAHKCPTCRKKLTERSTHPIYLPIS